jgi:threonine dehydrogenase-like Zn-dependent dehydrogenase
MMKAVTFHGAFNLKVEESAIIIHTTGLDQAARSVDIFANRKENRIKVLLKPHG